MTGGQSASAQIPFNAFHTNQQCSDAQAALTSLQGTKKPPLTNDAMALW